MASEVSICNASLIAIGEDTITSLSDDTEAARLCNQRYPELRDALLSMFPWKFAIKRASLNPLSSAPVYGFTIQFQLPSDYLRLYYLNDTLVWYPYQDEEYYRIEGRNLLFESTECYIRYIFRNTQVAEMCELFKEALSAYIAYQLAKSLTDDRNLRKDLKDEFIQIRAEAQYSDSVEEIQGYMTPDTFINARV